METAEDLLASIRWNYSMVYTWVIENGISSIEKSKLDNLNWSSYDDEKFLEYKTEIKNLQLPNHATLEQMQYVAELVSTGLFERHYMEQFGDFTLGQISRNIITMANRINEIGEEENFREELFAISDNTYKDDESYFEAADRFYSTVFINNSKNIGGKVALADTNWETQKRNRNLRKTLFRKPHLLNLNEIEHEDNLFKLCFNNQISIISIIVK